MYYKYSTTSVQWTGETGTQRSRHVILVLDLRVAWRVVENQSLSPLDVLLRPRWDGSRLITPKRCFGRSRSDPFFLSNKISINTSSILVFFFSIYYSVSLQPLVLSESLEKSSSSTGKGDLTTVILVRFFRTKIQRKNFYCLRSSSWRSPGKSIPPILTCPVGRPFTTTSGRNNLLVHQGSSWTRLEGWCVCPCGMSFSGTQTFTNPSVQPYNLHPPSVSPVQVMRSGHRRYHYLK